MEVLVIHGSDFRMGDEGDRNARRRQEVTGAMRFACGALDDNDHAVTRPTSC